MKRFWPLLVAVLFSVCYVLFSQTEAPVAVQWTWHEGKVFERYGQTRVLQFGLRSDGFVVWREIVSATNSPAEIPMGAHRSRMAPRAVWADGPISVTNDLPMRSPDVRERIIEMPPQIPPLPR